MGAGYLGKATNWAPDVHGAQDQAEREDQWGEMPGQVVSFDPAKQTISVQPLYKKRLNGVPTDLPVLLDVPVRFPRMGGHIITMRVRPGDRVTLRPQMRNTEAYHAQGGAFAAADARSFSLSDMEAFLDGGESLAQPISDFGTDELEIRSEDGKTKIQVGDKRTRLFRGRLRIVQRKDANTELLQLKIKASDDPNDTSPAEMHITINWKTKKITTSHAIELGADPNPQD